VGRDIWLTVLSAPDSLLTEASGGQHRAANTERPTQKGSPMGLTREHAHEILGTYIRARETQDPDLICTIFTPDVTYHERVLGDPIPGRDAIRA